MPNHTTTPATAPAWISCADRLPTANDANDLMEVWWWLPRYASHGAQLDLWHEPEDATHWMSGDEYPYADDPPPPPTDQRSEVTDHRPLPSDLCPPTSAL